MADSEKPERAFPQISFDSGIAWVKENWPRYWELGLFALIVLIGAGLRFWDLGSRAIGHDESSHAVFSWYLYNGDGYQHDPMMHGPFKFYAVVLIWRGIAFLSSAPIISNWAHWGPNDYTVRILPAIFGTALIALPYFFRSYLGRVGALLAALFLAFSPVLLFFSRFIRDDIIVAFYTLAAVICIWRYLTERRALYLYLIAGLLALGFTTMEATHLTSGLFLIYLDLLFAREVLGRLRERAEPRIGASEASDAKSARRARKKEPPTVPQRRIGEVQWTLIFIVLVPFAWLIAVTWPLTGKWRARWGLDEFPLSGDLLIVVGTLAGVQIAAAVQLIPFIGGKENFYREVDEETLMKATVILLLAVSAYVGLLWRPRTWLVAAAIFYSIFVVLYTSLFTNMGGFVFDENANEVWSAICAIVFLLLFVLPALVLLWWPHPPFKETWQGSVERSLILAAGVGYAAFAVVFTMVLANTGFWSGIWGSLDYWLVQQGVGRGDQPVYYPLMILSMYEFLPLVFAVAGGLWFLLRRQFLLSLSAMLAVCVLVFLFFTYSASLAGMIPVLVVTGAVLVALRRDLFTTFLVFWAVGSLIEFATASEKMPQHAIYIAIPTIILAAKSLDILFERFRVSLPLRWRSPETLVLLAVAAGALSMIILWLSAFSTMGAVLALLLGVAAAGLIVRAIALHGGLLGAQVAAALIIPALFVITARDGIRASFQLGDWPREILSYADVSPDIPWVRDRLVEKGKETGLGHDYPIVVDNDLAWPFVWYLRDFKKVQWASGSMPVPVKGSIVVLAGSHELWMDPYLDDYQPPVSIRHLWWFGDGPQYYNHVTLKSFFHDLLEGSTWRTWRDYFIYRQPPWGPPPNDAWVYFPKSVENAGTTAVEPAPSIPTVTAQAQQTIGATGTGRGQFSQPTGLDVDAAGNLYVADSRNNRIEKFDPEGKILTVLGPGGDKEATFNEPWMATVDKDGNIYVADTWSHRILKFDPDLNVVGEWGKPFTAIGERQPNPDELFGPRDIAMDADGNLLVTDTGNKRVVKFTPDGQPLDSFGEAGAGPGEFNEPVGVAVAPNGDIYVADTWNRRVQRFDSQFNYISEFSVKGWSSTEVTAKPYLVVLGDGRVILSNPINARIELYDQKGQAVAAWELPAPPGGVKARPVGLALSAQGFLYVSDCVGNVVYRLPLASLTGP